MAKIIGRLTRCAVSVVEGALTGHVTIGRMISGSYSSDTSVIDNSDFDDGADDSSRAGTRNRKLTISCNRDQADAGQQVLFQLEDAVGNGSFRYRVAEAGGVEEYIQDGHVTQLALAGNRPDMHKLNISIQLSGPRVRQNQT